jgi:Bacteriophage T4-like portal protein (Gp20)
MADNVQPNFFTRTFNNIVNRLPYTGNAQVINNIKELNPKFETFYNVNSSAKERVYKQAVSTSQDAPGIPSLEGIVINKAYHDFLYALIDTDKPKRVADYRVMASYAEISHALDEICDEMLVKDDKGKYCTLTVAESKDPVIVKELQKNFQNLIEQFNLDNKGFEYFRAILIDAELFFENVINDKKEEAGIIGVVQIPTEHINPIYDNIQNMLIKGYLLRKPVIDKDNQNRTTTKQELIPLERHQVTYFHSHTWNEHKTIRLPYLEVARRAYKQLSLIEDSIVVYRLVRAPERLVFKVDVGNLPAPKAEAYIKRLMQSYWSRRTYDNDQGQNVNVYDPQSMLDSYWFAKRPDGGGTDVSALTTNASLGQLDDLNYFVKKLYKALRVPTSRLDPEAKFADGAEILREELKFARLVIRFQRQFASTLKETLITHLKLKGLWDQYKLKEHDVHISFNPPTYFHAAREAQIHDLKVKSLNDAIQTDAVSKSYALKKYMGWTDDELKVNREWMKKDAAFSFEVAQITNAGPNWRQGITGGGTAGGGEGGAAAGGAGGGTPPAFGPGPGGGASALPPTGGEAPAGGEGGGEAPAGPEAAGGAPSALPAAQ